MSCQACISNNCKKKNSKEHTVTSTTETITQLDLVWKENLNIWHFKVLLFIKVMSNE